MAQIIIDALEAEGKIILDGDIDKLSSNRFAMRYLKDFFALTVENGRFVITVEGQFEDTLTKLRDMIVKYGFTEGRSVTTEKILLQYYEEEDKFDKFSQKASRIRNNDCDIEDFNEFTEAVRLNMANRSLYELQLLSAYHMAFSQNACNFSVPGAGKTSIVYAAYSFLKSLTIEDGKHVDKLLIVGPLSSFGPWENEYKECFGRSPSSKRLSSTLSKQIKTDYLYSLNTSEMTLISYASLSSLKDDIIVFLKHNRVMVVLDEAHKIKNVSGGLAAESALEIAKFGKARVVLTGTPAPNGYEDLYNMFKFIWPNKNIIGFHTNQLRDMTLRKNDPRISNLINTISPYFIRIKKSDLGIPPAIVHPPIVVEMGPVQSRIYNAIEKRYIESIVQNNENDLNNKFKSQLVNAKVIRLMQAATNPTMLMAPLSEFLIDEDIPTEAYKAICDTDMIKDIVDYNGLETPEKYIAAKKLIDQIIGEGGKVVVWVSFIHTIKEFKKYLAKNGILSQELYGGIPIEKEGISEDELSDCITRERIVSEFQKDDCEYKVIIANPFAVAESISLHKACHNAIYLERTFNAAHFVQSKDRIHRYGLKSSDETHYYFIMSKDTIDETIDERLSEKERRMFTIMESMPIPLFDNISQGLGDEDIKVLIRDYVRRTKKI